AHLNAPQILDTTNLPVLKATHIARTELRRPAVASATEQKRADFASQLTPKGLEMRDNAQRFAGKNLFLKSVFSFFPESAPSPPQKSNWNSATGSIPTSRQ
ncbi:MAG TPA: hypothetical protein VNI36_01595, partial [Candidatus Dormibacteraeota bacterium]|nr:hypothetical protein [Candidatus Dormibacteraeota bacterium]